MARQMASACSSFPDAAGICMKRQRQETHGTRISPIVGIRRIAKLAQSNFGTPSGVRRDAASTSRIPDGSQMTITDPGNCQLLHKFHEANGAENLPSRIPHLDEGRQRGVAFAQGRRHSSPTEASGAARHRSPLRVARRQGD